jgi:uncharacterized protein (TIGR00730 family)
LKNLDRQKVLEDLDLGIETLEGVEDCVTIFGSARMDADAPYAKSAYDLAYKLSSKGYNIITGGGGGIMEAANKGAYDAKCAQSIGLNIKLPHEQNANRYTTKNSQFRYFFIRKSFLVEKSHSCIIFPGGFGTLDEMFEMATLIQTQKIKDMKVYLFGKDFWEELLEFVHNKLVPYGMISKEDVKILHLCDDVDYLVQKITDEKDIGCDERRG